MNRMRQIRLAMSSLMALSVLVCALAMSHAQDSPGILLTEDEFERQAVTELDGCRVSLERRKKEAHLLHFRHDCRQPLEEKLALLKKLLETLVPDLDDRKALRTLFVGRLAVTFPELAQRVALAASQHQDWDYKRAWKESGYSNRFFLQLISEQDIFPELQDMLATLGFEVQVASVEKILMAKPKNIPFGPWLLEHGADPITKLPFDALTWFHLESMPENSSITPSEK